MRWLRFLNLENTDENNQMKANSASRRQFIIRSAGLAAACATFGVKAETYPSHPVRMVVAYAPGGSTDLVARLVSQNLSTNLGTSIVVENKAGGGTAIGTRTVQNARPDGYTLLFGTNAFVIHSLITKPKPWDPLNDFEPVALITQQALGLLVRPGLKINSVEDLIKYAKANPGKLNFASSGVGSNQHLTGEAFQEAANIELLHVPYKGAGPAIQDLLGERVDMMFTSLVGIGEYISNKKILLLATTGLKRNRATPDTPTVAEGGLPGFESISWQGVLAPAKTPPAVVDKLYAELLKLENANDVKKSLDEQGMELNVKGPDELRKTMQKELDIYTELLKKRSVI